MKQAGEAPPKVSHGWGAIAYFLSLYFFIPILLSKAALGASWKAIGLAYAFWFGLLFMWGASSKGTKDERIGWPIVMGMFFTIPAILVIVLLLRELAGVDGRREQEGGLKSSPISARTVASHLVPLRPLHAETHRRPRP